jgi:hypothetical protein
MIGADQDAVVVIGLREPLEVIIRENVSEDQLVLPSRNVSSEPRADRCEYGYRVPPLDDADVDLLDTGESGSVV